MARRGNNSNQSDQQVEGDSTIEQAPVTEATAETDVQAAEANGEAAEVAEPKTEAAPVDLTAFQEAVNTAVQGKNEADGHLTEEQITPVNEAYRALDGLKAKNQARTWVDDQVRLAIGTEKDLHRAVALVDVKDGLTAAGGAKADRPPADPMEAFVQSLAAHRIAVGLIESNVPEGVDFNAASERVEVLTNEVAEQVDAYVAWVADESEDKGDAPDVNPVVRQAVKLSAGKASGGTRTASGGPRRSVKIHLSQVFADKEPGAFMTVNEIAKAASTEYGTDRPSSGAVSASLFKPKKDGTFDIPEGIEAVEKGAIDGKNPKGARKAS